MYDEWATFGDKALDVGEGAFNLLNGVSTSLTDLVIEAPSALLDTAALYTIWIAETAYNRSCDEAGLPRVSFLTDADREIIAQINAGIAQAIADPGIPVEAIGQQADDVINEKGWAYGIGYVVMDVIGSLVIDKGMSEATKGSKVAGEIVEHADDVADAGRVSKVSLEVGKQDIDRLRNRLGVYNLCEVKVAEMKFKEFDMVKIRNDYDTILRRGAIGVIIVAYNVPDEAYEVEFVDDERVTFAQCVLRPDDLELV